MLELNKFLILGMILVQNSYGDPGSWCVKFQDRMDRSEYVACEQWTKDNHEAFEQAESVGDSERQHSLDLELKQAMSEYKNDTDKEESNE